MSSFDQPDLTHDQAQDAVDNGDVVTTDELQEMNPDKNLNQIQYDIQKDQIQLELKSQIDAAYEFNEPREAAKQGRKTCHTGPKGVLTDFEEAKLKMKARRFQEKLQKENKMYLNIGNTSSQTQYKATIIDANKLKATKKQIRKDKIVNNINNAVIDPNDIKLQDTDDDDSDDTDDDDDDFDDLDDDPDLLLKYKLERMKIIEQNRPRYGNTKEVTAWTFEKEVDNAPDNVFVVMHVYQDYLERCVRMNYAMAQVAKSYQHVKFLRARSDRIGLDKYPDVGLPTLIVFKNGIQLQNHIAVNAILGKDVIDTKDLEDFLIKNKVIKPITVIPTINDLVLNNKNNKNNKNKNKKSNISLKNNFNATTINNNDDSSDSELDID